MNKNVTGWNAIASQKIRERPAGQLRKWPKIVSARIIITIIIVIAIAIAMAIVITIARKMVALVALLVASPTEAPHLQVS